MYVMIDSLVTIVLPIYDVEKYIELALDSIYNQTYKNLEIICIIDGSPDSSLAICKNYAKKDDRIKIISHPNCGCAKTRNRGITESTGEFICFIDPDDTISQNYIESLVNAIIQTNADIAVADKIRIKNNNFKYRARYKEINAYENLSKILEALHCPPDYAITNKMYKASLIKNNSIFFDEKISWCDDVRFCIDTLFLCKRLTTVGGATYYYNKRATSISHSTPTKERQIERFNAMSSAVSRFLAAKADIPRAECTVTKRVINFGILPILRIRIDFLRKKEIVLLFGIIPILIRKCRTNIL